MTDIDFDSWNDLWDESLYNSIFLVDGAREVMGFSLNQLGYSLNSVDDKELRLAQENLFTLQPNVRAIIGDEVLQLMPRNEAIAAITWSGSASEMIDQNSDLNFSIPKEGTNIFMDNMVIPKTSKNTKGAHEFINYMMDPDVSAKNTDWVGYSTPNIAAQELLDPDIISDQRFYPSSDVIENSEYYQYLGKEDTQKYNDLFLEFKMY
jgi:spermidine/putrescine transport system substrate-binding protein